MDTDTIVSLEEETGVAVLKGQDLKPKCGTELGWKDTPSVGDYGLEVLVPPRNNLKKPNSTLATNNSTSMAKAATELEES